MASRANNRGVLIAGGAFAALAAGLALAFFLAEGGQDEPATPPPASRGGLVVETVQTSDRLDPARPLRCFVAGQFVGEMTLAACAERNGVASGALDVGVDETGALAAADQAGTVLTPLPPLNEATAAELAPPAERPAAAQATAPSAARPPAPAAACWRYSGSEWRRLPGDMSLNACVQTLFAGRCERPGAATYGRWGQQTLRLVPGRVETSSDNRTFRTLVEQGPNCAIPATS